MSLFDLLSYDLDTVDGQLEAIQDIVDEQNHQYDVGTNFKGLQVAFFDTVTITLNSPPSSGDPITVVRHGLGYAPIFLAYLGILSTGGVFPMPIIDFLGATGLNGAVTFWADATNLYVKWNDSAPTPTQHITYIIFSNPITS